MVCLYRLAVLERDAVQDALKPCYRGKGKGKGRRAVVLEFDILAVVASQHLAVNKQSIQGRCDLYALNKMHVTRSQRAESAQQLEHSDQQIHRQLVLDVHTTSNVRLTFREHIFWSNTETFEARSTLRLSKRLF